MKRQYIFLIVAVLLLTVLISSCTDLKKDLPTATTAGAVVHNADWSDTASANFHGRVLKLGNYNFDQCISCHAANFKGGTSGVQCYTCHASYPHSTNWSIASDSSYHGQYLVRKSFTLAECQQCHGSALNGGTSGKTCYSCHSQYPHASGWVTASNNNFHGKAIKNLEWSMSTCKVCHGSDYKGGISKSSCLTCHNKADGPENCTVCHGSTNAAPPKDLSGNTATSFAGVGAHQSHLISNSSFAAVACNECHTVPSLLASTGHLDLTTGAEVMFQGTVVKSTLASMAGSDLPAYAASTSTCSNTYCHGYFPNGNKQSVVWNDVSGQSGACGSCHGDITKSTTGDKALPKTSLNGGTHPNDTRCSVCHSSSINASFELNTSKHLNGTLDFR